MNRTPSLDPSPRKTVFHKHSSSSVLKVGLPKMYAHKPQQKSESLTKAVKKKLKYSKAVVSSSGWKALFNKFISKKSIVTGYPAAYSYYVL